VLAVVVFVDGFFTSGVKIIDISGDCISDFLEILDKVLRSRLFKKLTLSNSSDEFLREDEFDSV
jgi:hypothetical protein